MHRHYDYDGIISSCGPSCTQRTVKDKNNPAVSMETEHTLQREESSEKIKVISTELIVKLLLIILNLHFLRTNELDVN